MPRRSTRLILTVIASTALVAGCGSSSGESADAYVKTVCSALTPFEKDVQKGDSALNVETFTSAVQGKKALQKYLSEVATDAQNVVSKVGAAGTPDVSNGHQASSTILTAFKAMSSALKTASSEADALPTSSPEAFATAAEALGTTVESSLKGIGSGLSGLKNGELDAAASKSSACAGLPSGS